MAVSAISTLRLAFILAAIFACQAVLAGADLEVRVVSSRVDDVSGSDALVRLSPPAKGKWSARLNGRDVTSSFRGVDGTNYRVALLTDLRAGKNVLEVKVGEGTGSKLEIQTHPLQGPVFSGPQQQPFFCQTAANGLGEALDVNCNAKTVVQYYYKSTRAAAEDWAKTYDKAVQMFGHLIPRDLPAGFKVYDTGNPPVDVARIVLSDGRTVPYIVRREIGVIDRAIYDIRFLHAPGTPLPTPWSRRNSSWNGKLLYAFGGGCGPGYRQGTLDFSANAASNEPILARGYAVATSTFNVFGNDCNHVLSAEAVSMVKEHFIKTFGEPMHTIGWGESGGGMEQYLIADNYPGLLDGIIPVLSFPDATTWLQSPNECFLLSRAVGQSTQSWTEAQKTAVSGYATWRTCSIDSGGGFEVDPRHCDSVIPMKDTYDPVARPKGARCDVYDNAINIYGRDSDTGVALRPLDNVGVQYGLVAFNEGKITAEQFVELNERIGGFDLNGNAVSARTRANPEGVRRAYQAGLVLNGGLGLRDTPVIDWRWYGDDLADGHDSRRSFVTRARLMAATGSAANQVILIDYRASTIDLTLRQTFDANPDTSLPARREPELVETMSRWLDDIAADRSPGTKAEKVARNKPEDLADGCWTAAGEEISGDSAYGEGGGCHKLYPQYGSPRIAAGGPATDDILKCELKPIDAADYTHPLTDTQMARLRAVFPSGVCDYKRPGVGQQSPKGVWQRF